MLSPNRHVMPRLTVFEISAVKWDKYIRPIFTHAVSELSCNYSFFSFYRSLIMPPPVGKGTVSFAFVRLSVRLSVRRVQLMAQEPEGLACPNSE